MNAEPSRLVRKLDFFDAVVLGLGSMIGAGIFAAAGPAALTAGSGLWLALIIAGLAAILNALTMAQLAAQYPESGGTYVYARKLLGPYWGFLAGWGFVIGKMASCAAMALTFAHYTLPEYAHMVAPLSVLILTFINYLGVKKTIGVTRLLLLIVLTTLTVIVCSVWFAGSTNWSYLSGPGVSGGLQGILQGAGLMFFAFAGYARIATLGEEVIHPKQTIPNAMFTALGLTFFIYLAVILSTLVSLPIETLIISEAPLTLVVQKTKLSALSPIVQIGAAIASLSVLLSLLAGVSRTVFAMATNKDLPQTLAKVHPQHKVPHRAEIFIGGVVAIVVSMADLRTAIGFSSFAILIYYSIANLSILRLKTQHRLYPKFLAWMGLGICLILASHLPILSIGGGIFIFVLGSIYYHITSFLR